MTKAYFAAVQEKVFDMTRGLITLDDIEEIRRTQGAIIALQAILDIDFAEEAANNAD